MTFLAALQMAGGEDGNPHLQLVDGGPIIGRYPHAARAAPRPQAACRLKWWSYSPYLEI